MEKIKEMISCIHNGKKKVMNILYLGKQKCIQACNTCEKIIRSSKDCEVLQ